MNHDVLLPIGYENSVAREKIVAIVRPDSAPNRRLIQEKRRAGHVIDATQGRKVRSILQTRDGFLVLSALQPATLMKRWRGQGETMDDDECEEE